MKDLPINFEQPLWLLLPVLLVSVAISAFLYYRNSSGGFTKKLNISLFLLRAFALFLLGILLLNPYFIKKTKILEKPKIVVAVDVSESVTHSQDSLLIEQSIEQNLFLIKEELSEQFDIDVLTFDHKTYEDEQISFNGKRTDIGQLLQYVNDKYYMLNLSALIILSDGQNNQGLSPEYALQSQSTEIYPIIYGDTLAISDLSIAMLYFNKVVRQDSKFPVEVIVQAEGLLNEKVIVQIEHKGKVVASKPLLISKDSYTKEVKFEIDSKTKGLQSFTARLVSEGHEKNHTNNTSKFYVQVVESGNKVLVLGHAPHPDLGAIASALRTTDGYSVSIKTLNDYPFKIDDYQLIIMHGLPSLDERSRRIFSQEALKNKAIWYIVSSSTDMTTIAEQNLAWEIANPNGVYEHVEPYYNEDFTSFLWPAKYSNNIEQFPPLYAPFSSFQSLSKSDVMLWQSIRGFQTNMPLQSFWSRGVKKYGLLSGEGLWKWRIYNYQEFANHELFNSFVTRVSSYLLTGVYDDHFNISYKNVYHETELIEWEAQVYNQAFEPITNAKLSIDITDEDGHTYPYQFSANATAYSLNLDYFEPGEYSFSALAETTDTIYKESGHFVVNAWNMERSSMGANQKLLKRLARLSNGKVFFPSQVEQLNQFLLNRADFKPRSSFTQKLINLIDIKWLAFIIILLLAIEWVLRKRNGAY